MKVGCMRRGLLLWFYAYVYAAVAAGAAGARTARVKASHHLAELGREMLATQHARRCTIQSMGSGHGVHSLCAEFKPARGKRHGSSATATTTTSPSSFSSSSPSSSSSPHPPCIFYSYGISHDYSFDTAMAEEWGCRGVALDPSVKHPSRLHANVTFHNIAARTMNATEDAQWDLVTTVPGLKRFLGHDRIDVLKMDCEGCEYALAQDILLEDPAFLHSVDQLALEIHVSRQWLKTEAHAHHLGLLYALAKEAGLELVETVLGGCHPDHEAPGCHPALLEAGFPCEKGKMCSNLLFARV